MKHKGNALVWLALIIGILALILAWSAFNRTGENLEEDAMEEVEGTDDQSAAAADALADVEVEAEVDTSVEEEPAQ